MLAICRRAALCVTFALLVAPCVAAQTSPEHDDELASSTECRMLIHLRNDGLWRYRGVVDYSPSGDVWLHCPGQSVPLTRTGDVFSFALFPDGSRLAVVRHLHRIPDSNAPALLDEIDVATGQVLRTEQLPARLYGYQVVSTCGTVLLLGYHAKPIIPGKKAPPLETDVTDLLTGEQTENANFNSIRCTADRSVVLRKIGAPWAIFGSLVIGATGDNTLAPDKVGDFGVSPNGKYVVFTTGDQVCIVQPAASSNAPRCVDRFWDRGGLDVSDDGEAWLTGDSQIGGCPGIRDTHLTTWTCDAIFSWNPTESAPRLIAFGYVDPYGVSLGLGQRLLALANNWKRN